MEIKEKITSFIKSPAEFFSSVAEEPLAETAKHLGILVIGMIIVAYLSSVGKIAVSFVNIISRFIIIFLITPLVLHYIMRLLKGTADLKETLAAYWYIIVYVGAASLPFLVLQNLFTNLFLAILVNIIFLVIFVWMIVLFVIGFKEVHELSAVKVIASFLLMALVFFLARLLIL